MPTLHLIPDPDCMSPRSDDSALGTLLITARRYGFGDRDAAERLRWAAYDGLTDLLRWRRPGLSHTYDADDDQLPCPRCRGAKPRSHCRACEGTGWVENPYHTHSEPSQIMRLFENHADRIRAAHRLCVVPVYVYDHSGIAIKPHPFSCGGDSGQVGWLFMTGAEVKEFTGARKLHACHYKQAEEAMAESLPVLQQWVNGDCWGYELRDSGAVIDACWGFYGDDPETNDMAQHLPTNWRELELVKETD